MSHRSSKHRRTEYESHQSSKHRRTEYEPHRSSKHTEYEHHRSSKHTRTEYEPHRSSEHRMTEYDPQRPKPEKKERIVRLFDSYVNTSMNMIDPQGIERLCSDIKVDCTDVKMLMLAWKMGAKKQGYFTEEEWKKGLRALQVDSLSKLREALPELKKEANSRSNLEDFYCYAFRYCLTEEMQKTVDVDAVCQLLDMVLGPHFPDQIKLFTRYLNEQSDYRAVNMDQWKSFLRFFNEISFPNLENYDLNIAWPVILDDFVDWVKEKQS